MKKSRILISLFVAIGLIFSFGISQSFAGDSIKVGIVLPLTGKFAKFGEIENKSFLMALKEINAGGGVNGKKIELIIEDTTGKPDVGRSAVEKLITQDKVVMLGGGYSSSVTWATIAVAQQNKVPFLVNTGSADKITEQGWEYIYRLNPPVSEYPGAFADFLKTNGKDIKTVAILHDNTLFGQSGAKKFVKQCEALGLEVILKEGYEGGAIDFKPLLMKVKAKKADLVYMISYIMDASLLMRQSKQLNLNPKMFVGGGAGFTLPEFKKNAGKASSLVFSATLWTPSVPYPGAKTYYDNFVAKYNTPTEYHGAEAYSAMYVIADTLKRAKSLNRDDIRDSLAKTNLITAFGPVKFISYGKKTNQNKLPTFLVQWIDGNLETVWPQKVATKAFVYPIPKWSKR